MTATTVQFQVFATLLAIGCLAFQALGSPHGSPYGGPYGGPYGIGTVGLINGEFTDNGESANACANEAGWEFLLKSLNGRKLNPDCHRMQT
ncbi:unnamed protein product [Protopolystoma xenopodis]|uniref:Uncharacterized protein n=1 Tax=Protopolystoma xenopodis TaxID=117903 RepID=A0A448XP29_9PLAT|nr:unnamed protein product [Protopolystoma xenopodis]